jgi:hypothetical protein
MTQTTASQRVSPRTRGLWITLAVIALRDIARTHAYFTTDEVWESVQRRWPSLAEPDRRTMAAVVQRAAARGMIVRTDYFQPSTRPVNHSRPVRVWRSLIHG